MRVFGLVGCLLAASVVSVFAADFPPPPGPPPVAPAMYAPQPPPPPFTWSGFYFGANGGFGFASGNATATATTLFGGATAISSGTFNGGVVGGQIGFNYQINSLVLGVEVDGDWSGQSRTNTTLACFGFCTVSETVGINWFATARARVGYAFDRVLVYATGGGAAINASDSVNASAFGLTVNIASISSTAFGYVVGGGVEAAIMPNLSARAEYLFMSSSNFSGSTTIPVVGGTITERATLYDNIVRVGLNYRFSL
jgi:outer membrane immunogenic protein